MSECEEYPIATDEEAYWEGLDEWQNPLEGEEEHEYAEEIDARETEEWERQKQARRFYR